MSSSEFYLHPVSYKDIDVSKYDGLFITGGQGKEFFDSFHSQALQAKILEFWNTKKPVAGVCHGVAILASIIDPVTRKSILYEKHIASFPWYFEITSYLATKFLLRLEDYQSFKPIQSTF